MSNIEDKMKILDFSSKITDLLSKMREKGLDVNDFYEQQLKYVINELSEFESERAINRAVCMNYVKYELVLKTEILNKENRENLLDFLIFLV